MAPHRLRPPGGMSQPQRSSHPTVVHAPEDRAILHVLHLLEHLLRIPCPVHGVHQAWGRSRSCGPGRFPHDLPGVGDAVEPLPTGRGLRAGRVAPWPRPRLAPQDAAHGPMLRAGQRTREQNPVGEAAKINRPSRRSRVAPREIERGGVLDHQHGRLRHALPGGVPGAALLQGKAASRPRGLAESDRALWLAPSDPPLEGWHHAAAPRTLPRHRPNGPRVVWPARPCPPPRARPRVCACA